MHEIKLNTKTVKLRDDIDELPIRLFNLANEYSMQDFEIGNSMEAVDRHHARIEEFLNAGKIADAIQVQRNLRMTFFSMLNKFNYKSMMFACHIYSIEGTHNNGIPYEDIITDYSPQNLIKIIDQLSDDGLTMEMVRGSIANIKKKLKSN